LIVHLPSDGKYESEWNTTKFINHLSSSLVHDRNAVDFLKVVARANGLTFRHIERIMTYIALSIIFTTSQKQEFFMPGPILGGLCVMKDINPGLFLKAKSGSLTLNEALDSFGFSKWPESHTKNFVGKWWRFALADDLNESEQRGFENFGRFAIDDRRDVIPTVANHIIDRMQIPEE
jgi:hypothetical protein